MDLQQSKCAVCNNTENLELDHDNKCCPRHTGVNGANERFCGKCVRGFLCKPCNRMLSFYEVHTGDLVVPNFDKYLAKGFIDFGMG